MTFRKILKENISGSDFLNITDGGPAKRKIEFTLDDSFIQEVNSKVAKTFNISTLENSGLSNGGELSGTHIDLELANFVKNSCTRGIMYGGVMSVASPTTINVSIGLGIVIDAETDETNPLIWIISIPQYNNMSLQHLSNSDNTFVMIDKSGILIQLPAEPTIEQSHQNLYLGRVIHQDRTSIFSLVCEPQLQRNSAGQFFNFIKQLGTINIGCRVYPNGNNMMLNSSGGTILYPGINYAYENVDVNSKSIPAAQEIEFYLATQTWISTSPTNIFPSASEFDSNGTIVANTGSDSTAINMRIFLTTDLKFIAQYGQAVFSSLAVATAVSSTTETFAINPILSKMYAIQIACISVTKNASNLSLTNMASFMSFSMWGENVGTGQGTVYTGSNGILVSGSSISGVNASTSGAGVVALSDSLNGSSVLLAATENAVGQKINRPLNALNNNFAQYDSNRHIKDNGISLTTSINTNIPSDLRLPTEKAVHSLVVDSTPNPTSLIGDVISVENISNVLSTEIKPDIVLTGTPSVDTVLVRTDNSNKIASTSFVHANRLLNTTEISDRTVNMEELPVNIVNFDRVVVNQTTLGLTFTLPVGNLNGKRFIVENRGTALFTMYDTPIAINSYAEFIFNSVVNTWTRETGSTSASAGSLTETGSSVLTITDGNEALLKNTSIKVNLPLDQIFIGNAGGSAHAVTASGDMSIVSSGITTINNNVVTNNKLSQAPALTWKGNIGASTGNVSDNSLGTLSESGSSILTINATNSLLSNATLRANLPNNQIYMGNVSDLPIPVTISGDITLTNTGASTIKTSVNLSGNPTTTTQPKGNNTTSIATTQYVETGLYDKLDKVPLNISVANIPTGGSIGTAATTVDIVERFLINQTSVNQTITLPNPTVSANRKIAIVDNVGSAAFHMYNVQIAPQSNSIFIWSGSAWNSLVAENFKNSISITTPTFSVTTFGNIFLIDCTANSIDITLQTIQSSFFGLENVFKRIDSNTINTCRIIAGGNDLIDGSTSLFLSAQNESVTLLCSQAWTWSIMNDSRKFLTITDSSTTPQGEYMYATLASSVVLTNNVPITNYTVKTSKNITMTPNGHFNLKAGKTYFIQVSFNCSGPVTNTALYVGVVSQFSGDLAYTFFAPTIGNPFAVGLSNALTLIHTPTRSGWIRVMPYSVVQFTAIDTSYIIIYEIPSHNTLAISQFPLVYMPNPLSANMARGFSFRTKKKVFLLCWDERNLGIGYPTGIEYYPRELLIDPTRNFIVDQIDDLWISTYNVAFLATSNTGSRRVFVHGEVDFGQKGNTLTSDSSPFATMVNGGSMAGKNIDKLWSNTHFYYRQSDSTIQYTGAKYVARASDGTYHAWGGRWTGGNGLNATETIPTPVQYTTFGTTTFVRFFLQTTYFISVGAFALEVQSDHMTPLATGGRIWGIGRNNVIGNGPPNDNIQALWTQCTAVPATVITDAKDVYSYYWDGNGQSTYIIRHDGGLNSLWFTGTNMFNYASQSVSNSQSTIFARFTSCVDAVGNKISNIKSVKFHAFCAYALRNDGVLLGVGNNGYLTLAASGTSGYNQFTSIETDVQDFWVSKHTSQLNGIQLFYNKIINKGQANEYYKTFSRGQSTSCSLGIGFETDGNYFSTPMALQEREWFTDIHSFITSARFWGITNKNRILFWGLMDANGANFHYALTCGIPREHVGIKQLLNYDD